MLGYVLFTRPGDAACMRRCDLAFTTHGLDLEVVDFTMGLRTGRERLAISAPVDRNADSRGTVARLLRLIIAEHDSNNRHAKAMLFANPGMLAPVRRFWLATRDNNKWLRLLLELLPLTTPLGGK